MRKLLFLVATACISVNFALAAQDCALGERYFGLASDRLRNYNNDEALGFLQQSIASCPTFAAYQQLGELYALSPEKADKARAVDAFVEAHQLAQDDPSRARSLLHYASLLARENDPQNAYPLIKEARALDPRNDEIAKLELEIEHQVRNPTEQGLVRGLRDSLFRPLKVASSPSRSGSGAAASLKPVTANGPAINIPINFETGSTIVDELTQANVRVLARALADPSLAGRKFLFVGHADVRGADAMNMTLSTQRARAIFQSVLRLEPVLKDRIEVTGRGSSEPIDRRENEEAYRANRRLQVLPQ